MITIRREFDIPKDVEDVLKKLKKSCFKAYLVGGSLRDIIMGKSPADYDITTDATPGEIIEVFSEFTTHEVGAFYGTVGVHTGIRWIEVTTFRTDINYINHRRPQKVVYGKELEEDLKRRDFTINALAYDGEFLYDYFDGIEHIENKVISAVGDPFKRFDEDALRMIRAIRFSAQLQFKIENKTEEAIYSMKDILSYLSKERMQQELYKLLIYDRNNEIFVEYFEVFKIYYKFLSDRDRYRNIAMGENFDEIIATIFLLETGAEFRYFSLSNSTKKFIKAVRKFSETVKIQDRDTMFDILKELEVTLAHDVLKFLLKEKFSEEDFLSFLDCEIYSRKQLEINGVDLKNIGASDEKIGIVLDRLLLCVHENKCKNTRDELTYQARKLIAGIV